MLYEYASSRGIQYIRVGYDGTHMTIADYVTPFSTREDDEGGYAVTASWVCPAAVAAGLAVSKVMLNTDQDISTDIREIGARPKPVKTITSRGIDAKKTPDGKIILTLETQAQREMAYAMFDCAGGRTLTQYCIDNNVNFDSTAKRELWKSLKNIIEV
jgi:hypothetical protein